MDAGAENALDLSIVIPAYNEERRLPSTLTEVLGALGPSDRSFEVVIVDDGSHDGTAKEVQRVAQLEPRVRLISYPSNRGKGHAARTGVLHAQGQRILIADADGATPFKELAKLERALEAGADVAIGSRAVPGFEDQVKAVWYRRAIGRIFNAIVETLVVRGFSDTQCGFKLFSGAAGRALFSLQHLDGYGFDVELLFLARRQGMRVDEIAVDWADRPGSKVNLLIDPARMLADLVRIRWGSLIGRYRRIAEPDASKGADPEPDLVSIRRS